MPDSQIPTKQNSHSHLLPSPSYNVQYPPDPARRMDVSLLTIRVAADHLHISSTSRQPSPNTPARSISLAVVISVVKTHSPSYAPSFSSPLRPPLHLLIALNNLLHKLLRNLGLLIFETHNLFQPAPIHTQIRILQQLLLHKRTQRARPRNPRLG